MKRARRNLIFGITGLVISSVILLIADRLGSEFDAFSILAPFIMLTLIASFNYLRYVKK